MHTLDTEVIRALSAKYARPGPRYTSYPTAADFGDLGPEVYESRLAEARSRVDEPWSVYVHVPFCAKRCDFCACSVIASPDYERVAAPYVDDLIRELELVSRRLGARRRLAQLHLGGGTPTYLSPALLGRVFEALGHEFQRDPEGEWSVELDARVTSLEHIELFGEYGVERVSLGVQDLDPGVQEKIGRVQSRERIAQVITACRRVGVTGVNLDLVYGLPGQTRESLAETIDAVLDWRPDRLALYGYAHVPWMPGRGNQKRIDEAALPDPKARLDMFLAARERLQAAGYQAIGMDHFALPDDALAQAERAGTLRRNFMGYTVSAGTDLLGLGVTAIGEVAGAYVQNTAKLKRWSEAIAAGELPTARGLLRSADDELRGAVISDLMCHHRVDKRAIEERFTLKDFDAHFAEELRALADAVYDGLLRDEPEALVLSESGKLFVRNVAMAFDARLRERRAKSAEGKPRFSATV